MRFFTSSLLMTMALAPPIFLTALPAKADDFGQRVTITVAPVWLLSTNSDANASAPPPPGTTGIGFTKDHPIVDDVRVDYGISFKINDKWNLALYHGNVGYQLGRILTIAPGVSFVSGAIYDHTDTIALSYAAGHGLTVRGSYFDHERQDVTGLCLNQKSCPSATGQEVSNTLSISEHGYTLGGSYDFGPNTKIGPLFTVAFDAKYVPRPSTPPSPNVIGLKPALGGLPSWVGSQTLFPYSLTMKLPIAQSTTFIPFVNYTNLPVLYHDSAVPEAYRGIVWGIIKVLSKNVTFSYTNLNLQTCRCIARVPPPDNLRLAFGIMKLDLHTQL